MIKYYWNIWRESFILYIKLIKILLNTKRNLIQYLKNILDNDSSYFYIFIDLINLIQREAICLKVKLGGLTT